MPASFGLYAAASTGLVAATVYQAYAQRQQFYPTVIHITSSKLSVLVLGKLRLTSVGLFGVPSNKPRSKTWFLSCAAL